MVQSFDARSGGTDTCLACTLPAGKAASQSNKVDAQLLLEWLAEHLQKGYPVKKAHELTNARMLSSSQTVAACPPVRSNTEQDLKSDLPSCAFSSVLLRRAVGRGRSVAPLVRGPLSTTLCGCVPLRLASCCH